MFQKPPVMERGAYRDIIVVIGAPAFIFGTVERCIGVREESLPVGRIIRTDGDPDGDGDRPVDAGIVARGSQGFENSLGDAAGRGRMGKAGDDDGKLVAAQPRHRLAFIQHARHAFGDGLQHPVARRMAK